MYKAVKKDIFGFSTFGTKKNTMFTTTVKSFK